MNVLVLGAGISGRGAEKLLRKFGASVFVLDEAKDRATLTEKFIKQFDLCVISPSVDLKHKIYKLCKCANVEVIAEVELAGRCYEGILIGITGTNGKTTTTKLLTGILNADGLGAVACGNVGYSFSECVAMDNPDIAVVELSSFQLEQMGNVLKPKIAMIINISPDHLDRHGNMDAYAKAKKNIALNQTEDDYLLLGADDIAVEYLTDFMPRSRVELVSVKDKVDGAYLYGDKLFYKSEEICSMEKLELKGLHNISNTLFCVAAAKMLGVNNEAIIKGLSEYKGEAHRINLCGKVAGKRFYNDSKGTNIGASLAACRTMVGSTALIVGGKDKGYDFEVLFNGLPSNIVKVLVIGEAADKLMESAKKSGYTNIERADSLESAVKMSMNTDAENVLLSPACSSFDSFKDYADRGKEFERIVEKIQACKV